MAKNSASNTTKKTSAKKTAARKTTAANAVVKKGLIQNQLIASKMLWPRLFRKLPSQLFQQSSLSKKLSWKHKKLPGPPARK